MYVQKRVTNDGARSTQTMATISSVSVTCVKIPVSYNARQYTQLLY